MDITELGRQAYRLGLSRVIADNPAMRDLWPSVPAAQHRQVIRDYADGWAAEQRETSPAEALSDEMRRTEELIGTLRAEIAVTTHARRLASLKRDRDEAETKLSRLATELGAAIQGLTIDAECRN